MRRKTSSVPLYQRQKYATARLIVMIEQSKRKGHSSLHPSTFYHSVSCTGVDVDAGVCPSCRSVTAGCVLSHQFITRLRSDTNNPTHSHLQRWELKPRPSCSHSAKPFACNCSFFQTSKYYTLHLQNDGAGFKYLNLPLNPLPLADCGTAATKAPCTRPSS